MKNELKSFTAKCLVLVNSPKFFILGGGEIPSECLGGCVGRGSSNTRTISELIMQFSSPISDFNPKFDTLFQTRPL